ncbi:hypothetical protein Tco_1446531 [Tanacetum coccineum]
MQAARDRQKSYADLKRKPMEFEVGDKVMLKVTKKGWRSCIQARAPEELSDSSNDISREPIRSQIVEVKRIERSRSPLSRFMELQRGPIKHGNVKINSGRNTPHLFQPRLRPSQMPRH